MFAESRTVWFDWKVRLFKGPTQFPLYMDIAIYLTSVEWFDQHFPCSSVNQLFVDFSNYIDLAIKFSQLPYNRINNQNRRDEERIWLCHLHHDNYGVITCDRTQLVRLHLTRTRLPPMLKLIVIKYGAVKVVTTQ